ncbi:MAG: hypothetical protein Q8M92_04910 [Candidatus Subteraquimicrobiales bacterium]|nr:hypothetical protein [Candidatus Subteraquimicrobiales bacterium]
MENSKVSLILWWLLFLSFVATSTVAPQNEFDTPSGLYRMFHYSTAVFFSLILLDILVKFKYLKRKWDNYPRRLNILLVLLFIVIFCFATGFIMNYERGYQHILMDFLPFLGCAIALLGVEKKDVFQSYLNIFADQVFIAAILGLYLLNTFPVIERSGYSVSHAYSSTLLLTAVLLLPSLAYLNSIRKIFIIFAYAVLSILSIYCQTRTDTFLFFVFGPFLTLLAFYKRKDVFSPKRRLKGLVTGFLIVVITFPIIYSYLNRDSSLEIAFEQTLQRFSGSPVEDTTYSDVIGTVRHDIYFIRGAEAAEFINNSTLSDLILGRGFGGTWDSSMYGINWHYVHFGPFHIALKGGFLLLVPFLLVYFFAMFLAWKNFKQYHYASGCFIYLCVRFVQLLTHGGLSHMYDIYIMWLIIGVCFSMEYKCRPICIAKQDIRKVRGSIIS